MFRAILVSICLMLSTVAVGDASLELKLEKIIEIYGLNPCRQVEPDALSGLGKKFFASKELSGNRDTSCETCHIEDKGFADGLSIAVGVGGDGESTQRLADGNGVLVQRNAFTLFERGNPSFLNFFWDSKIESDSSNIYSPFGDQVSNKFNSALAVASILPLTERDEFLGKNNPFSENEIRQSVGDKLYQDKYDALSKSISSRVWSSPELSSAALDAGLSKEDFELADVGNALAEFIASEFSCPRSKWQDFLRGDKEALTPSQKTGAITFFGAARCASCHTPPLFSDFKHHSIGVPQGAFGPHTRTRDIGRAAVTNSPEDIYLFRTPPLISVSKTAPYGHNGIFPNLESVILHHVNPVTFFIDNPNYSRENDLLRLGRYLDSRSSRLKFIEINSLEDLSSIIDFMETL